MSYPLDNGYRVTAEMRGVHPIHTDYPLLPGDVLTKYPDDFYDPDLRGTWMKHTGLGIAGFALTPEQEATLEEVGPGWVEIL